MMVQRIYKNTKKQGQRAAICLFVMALCIIMFLPSHAFASYDYYKNGNIKTIWDGYTEKHFDPYGHCMETSHLFPFFTTKLGAWISKSRTEPQYVYDELDRLTKFEAEANLMDLPSAFYQVKYTYQYDSQGRIKTVKSMTIYPDTDPFQRADGSGKSPDILGTTQFYYNEDGSYTAFETYQQVGNGAKETREFWICRFDENGELVQDIPYRSDGRHYYAMMNAGFWEGDEDFEEWYDYYDYEKYSDHAPSAEDLDEILADIRYPRSESFYLSYYKYAAVKNNATAFIDPNANDVLAENNTFRVTIGEDTVVLAESGDYACVIFPNLGRAGWIKTEYLTCD